MTYVQAVAVDVGVAIEGAGSVLVSFLDADGSVLDGPNVATGGLYSHPDPCYGVKLQHPNPGASDPVGFGIDSLTRYTSESAWVSVTLSSDGPPLATAYNTLPRTGTPSAWMVVEDQDATVLGNDLESANLTVLTGFLTDFYNAIYVAEYDPTVYRITGAAGDPGTAGGEDYRATTPIGEIVVMFGTTPPPSPTPRRRPIGSAYHLRQRQTPFIR